jgi:arylsulfatase A-like enzyme
MLFSRVRFFCAIALVIALGFAEGCGDPASSPEPGRPVNVLLVTLDTVRADHLGSYGFPADITPNLDRFAMQATRFERAFSTASVTPVSHASILTGRYPYSHGLRVLSAEGSFRLEPTIPSLAGVLRESGFRTGAVHSSFTVSDYFGFRNGFDFFDSFETKLEKQGKFADWRLEKNQRRADITTDVAIDFLDAGDQPFFLWVHYWDMHDPILLPDDDFMPPADELEVNRWGAIQPNRALYAAEIRYMDHHLGRLLEALKTRGVESDTLVVIVADHGEGLGDHGWRFHRLLYQEQIRVPLLLRIPGVEGGGRITDLVRSIDIFPTVLDYLGISIPEDIQGRSLRPLLEGDLDTPRVAYADQINVFDKNAKMIQRRPNDLLLHSVQDQRWKLIYRPLLPESSELYDLEQDPGEENNLFRADHPEAKRLLAELADHPGWVLEPPTGMGMDPSARRQLEALGYVEKDEGGAEEPMAWSYTPPARFGEEFFTSQRDCEAATGSTCVLIRTPEPRP